MSRIPLLLILVCLLMVSAGCRNRANGPFANWYSDGMTIAPPPTGTLQIPSVSKNQPYYSPGNANRTALNTQAQAPLPGPAGSRLTGAGVAGVQPLQTRFVETRSAPGGVPQGTLRTAALPGSGYSYSRSTDYRTTQTDERADASRLPVTDASTVRAPSQYGSAGSGRFPVQQTYVARNFGYQSGPRGPVPFSGRGVLVNPATQFAPNVYRGQAVMVAPQNFGVNSRPTVLAQATATATPASGQFVWRDRELNSRNLR